MRDSCSCDGGSVVDRVQVLLPVAQQVWRAAPRRRRDEGRSSEAAARRAEPVLRRGSRASSAASRRRPPVRSASRAPVAGSAAVCLRPAGMLEGGDVSRARGGCRRPAAAPCGFRLEQPGKRARRPLGLCRAERIDAQQQVGEAGAFPDVPDECVQRGARLLDGFAPRRSSRSSAAGARGTKAS